MSSSEFTAWIAYYRLHPFGPEREDQRAGEIAAIIANVFRNRKRQHKQYTWRDIFGVPAQQRSQSPNEQLAIVEMLNMMYGGEDLRNLDNPL